MDNQPFAFLPQSEQSNALLQPFQYNLSGLLPWGISSSSSYTSPNQPIQPAAPSPPFYSGPSPQPSTPPSSFTIPTPQKAPNRCIRPVSIPSIRSPPSSLTPAPASSPRAATQQAQNPSPDPKTQTKRMCASSREMQNSAVLRRHRYILEPLNLTLPPWSTDAMGQTDPSGQRGGDGSSGSELIIMPVSLEVRQWVEDQLLKKRRLQGLSSEGEAGLVGGDESSGGAGLGWNSMGMPDVRGQQQQHQHLQNQQALTVAARFMKPVMQGDERHRGGALTHQPSSLRLTGGAGGDRSSLDVCPRPATAPAPRTTLPGGGDLQYNGCGSLMPQAVASSLPFLPMSSSMGAPRMAPPLPCQSSGAPSRQFPPPPPLRLQGPSSGRLSDPPQPFQMDSNPAGLCDSPPQRDPSLYDSPFYAPPTAPIWNLYSPQPTAVPAPPAPPPNTLGSTAQQLSYINSMKDRLLSAPLDLQQQQYPPPHGGCPAPAAAAPAAAAPASHEGSLPHPAAPAPLAPPGPIWGYHSSTLRSSSLN